LAPRADAGSRVRFGGFLRTRQRSCFSKARISNMSNGSLSRLGASARRIAFLSLGSVPNPSSSTAEATNVVPEQSCVAGGGGRARPPPATPRGAPPPDRNRLSGPPARAPDIQKSSSTAGNRRQPHAFWAHNFLGCRTQKGSCPAYRNATSEPECALSIIGRLKGNLRAYQPVRNN
jgi:hypothetical protein